MEFEVVEFWQRQTTDLKRVLATYAMMRRLGCLAYLCISRISVEDVREELARTSHSCYNQSVDVKAVYHEEMREVVCVHNARLRWYRRRVGLERSAMRSARPAVERALLLAWLQ